MIQKPDEEEIFKIARNIPSPDARRVYLAQACGDDSALHCRVQALLQVDEGAGSFLNCPIRPQGATVDVPIIERPGAVIGPYKLLQLIGEGGMGVVWMAEQTQPVLRKVALKIIKAGMDSGPVIARFEAERQALAMMDHVNIARVFDGGTTEAGRPYFVMELIHGVPITKYCDDNHLTPRERLELFVPVCQAIQHAHQKGIIHRDIKPSNVMVTLYDGKPVPKVIDFGVAKATEQKLTERTLFTQYGTMVGTLEYMSPEQAEMSALGVDTRSDIYSLGVLLYELLTGSTPLTHKRLKEAAYAEILRMIKEEEPPKPSMRLFDSGEALASISAQRHMEPAKLTKLVRGELDWIVMKCLEKDRKLRYETANGFAADVQRYLNDEPVLACPPSVLYQVGKYARRNKAGMAVTGMILFFLVVLGGGIGWVTRDREAREEEVARDQAARLAATQQLAEEAIQVADRHLKEGNWPEAYATVKRAEGLLENGERDEEFQHRLREILKDLAMVARVEEIRLQQAEVKVDHFDNSGAARAYAQAFRDYGIDVEALNTVEAAARIQARSIQVQLAAALDDWARVGAFKRRADKLNITRAADPDPARNRLRDALERTDRKVLAELADAYLLKPDLPPATASFLAADLITTGSVAKGAAVLRKAQQRYPDDFWINHNLAYCLHVKMRPPRTDEAIRFYTAAAALRPKSPGALVNLGNALHARGFLDDAIVVFERAIDLKKDYAEAYRSLGMALREKGLFDKAIAAHQNGIRLKPGRADAHDSLGLTFMDKGSFDEAIAAFNEAIRVKPDHARAYLLIAEVLAKKGEVDAAITQYRKAIGLQADLAVAHNALGVALAAKDQVDAAIAAYRTAIRYNPKLPEPHHNLGNSLKKKGERKAAIAAYSRAIEIKVDYPAAWTNRGATYYLLGQYPDAIRDFTKAIEMRPSLQVAWIHRGDTYKKVGKLDLAIADYSKALALDSTDAATLNRRGLAFRQQKHLDEALADYTKAIELKKPAYPDPWKNRAVIYLDLGQFAKAVADYSQAIKLNPKDAWSWNGRGVAYQRLQQPDKALADFSKAIELDAEFALAWQNRAGQYTNLKRFNDALADYSKALALQLQNPVLWIKRGTAFANSGQFAKAISDFSKAIELRPTLPDAWVNRGNAYQRSAELDKAIVDYSVALVLNPKDPGIWQNRGETYLRLKQWEKAQADYSKSIAINPKTPASWYGRGLASTNLRQWDKAVADYSKALELAPQSAGLHNNLAWLLAACPEAKCRDPKRAVELATKAVALVPKEGNLWNTLGVAHYCAGDWKGAIATLEKSIVLRKGGDAFDWFFLAMSHEQLGNKKEARKWYDEAVQWMDKNAPQDEELRRFRAEAVELLGIKNDK